MELLLLESAGLAPDAVLSIRAGGARRQQPLPCSAPFALPQPPAVITVEALGWCGWSRQDLTMAESLTEDGLCKVPLENEHGKPMSVTFRVKRLPHQKSVTFTEDAGASMSAAEEQQILESKVQKKIKKEISIDSYMKNHGVNDFMREVFRRLVQEQPEDPHAFIAALLRQKAGLPKLQDPPPLYRPPSLEPIDEEPAPPKISKRIQEEPAVIPVSKELAPPEISKRIQEESAAIPVSKQLQRNPSLIIGERPVQLRKRARETLVHALRDGRLATLVDAIANCHQNGSSGSLSSTRVSQLRKRAGETLARAKEDDRLASAVDKLHQQPSGTKTDHVAKLRKRARHVLATAFQNGTLGAAFAKCQQHNCNVSFAGGHVLELRNRARQTLADAKVDGRLSEVVSRLQQQLAITKNSDRENELRVHACNTLARAHVDGRLITALEKPRQQLQSSDAATVGDFCPEESSPDTDHITSLRKRARRTLAQAHRRGRLPTAIAKCTDHGHATVISVARLSLLRRTARDTLALAKHDGRLAAALSRLQQQPTSSKSHQDLKELRTRARNTLAQAHMDGRLSAALEKPQQKLESDYAAIASVSELAEEVKTDSNIDRKLSLRKRARCVLERAHRNGRLAVAVAKCQAGNSNARLPSARSAQLRKHAGQTLALAQKDGRLATVLNVLQQGPSGNKSSECVTELRARARETLAQANRDGRLADVLDRRTPGRAADIGLTQEEAQRTASLRRRAKAMLAEAQRNGQLLTAIELLLPGEDAPMPQIVPSISQPERRPAPQPLVSPEASEAPSAEAPAAGVDVRKYSWSSSLALTPSFHGEAGSDYQLHVRTSSFNEPTTPGTYCLPSPSAWVLMDGESSGEEAEVVPTPRLTQFTPAPVRRASSQATTVESDQMSQFIPDRKAHVQMGQPAGVLADSSLSQFKPPGHDHPSQPPNPARYREITPRMSHFMPGQDPSTPRLTQLVPDVALTPRVLSFGVTARENVGLATGIGQAHLTPRLSGFSLEPFDAMMATAGGSHLGPPQPAKDPFGGAQHDPFGGAQHLGPPTLGPFAGAHLGPPAAPMDMLGGCQTAQTHQLLDFMPSPRR